MEDILEALATETEAPTEAQVEETPAPAPEAPAEETPEQPEPPETPEEPEPPAAAERAPTEALDDDALFSEESLGTPEGVAKARETLQAARKAVQEERAKTSHVFLRMKKREEKAKAQYAEAQKMHEAAQALNQRLATDMSALQAGDARGIIDTLGRLTGRPGKQVFEELALAVATDGKGTPESKKLKELEERYERRVRELEERWEQEKRAQQDREAQAVIERRKQELVQLGSDASRFPAVAHFVGLGKRKEVAETLAEYKMKAFEEGSPISDEEAVKLLEDELKPHLPAPPPAPGGGTGSPHAAPQQRKPASGGLPGQTLAPSLTTEPGGSKRELTDEEHRQALINDDQFWAALGQ